VVAPCADGVAGRAGTPTGLNFFGSSVGAGIPAEPAAPPIICPKRGGTRLGFLHGAQASFVFRDGGTGDLRDLRFGSDLRAARRSHSALSLRFCPGLGRVGHRVGTRLPQCPILEHVALRGRGPQRQWHCDLPRDDATLQLLLDSEADGRFRRRPDADDARRMRPPLVDGLGHSRGSRVDHCGPHRARRRLPLHHRSIQQAERRTRRSHPLVVLLCDRSSAAVRYAAPAPRWLRAPSAARRLPPPARLPR
jgi:hypothetical protein